MFSSFGRPLPEPEPVDVTSPGFGLGDMQINVVPVLDEASMQELAHRVADVIAAAARHGFQRAIEEVFPDAEPPAA